MIQDFVSNEKNNMQKNIVDQCFANQGHPMILLGTWSSEDLKYVNKMELPFILITSFESNELKNYERLPMSIVINETTFERLNYPVTNVGIKISSMTELQKMLRGFRSSIWWNHEALVLIINQDIENRCNSPDLFIDAAWNMNLLNVMYLCHEEDLQLSLYSFNPYGKIAPKFWKVISRSTDRFALMKFKNNTLNRKQGKFSTAPK